MTEGRGVVTKEGVFLIKEGVMLSSLGGEVAVTLSVTSCFEGGRRKAASSRGSREGGLRRRRLGSRAPNQPHRASGSESGDGRGNGDATT